MLSLARVLVRLRQIAPRGAAGTVLTKVEDDIHPAFAFVKTLLDNIWIVRGKIGKSPKRSIERFRRKEVTRPDLQRL